MGRLRSEAVHADMRMLDAAQQVAARMNKFQPPPIHRHRLLLPGGEVLGVYLARFVGADFHPSAFQQAGLALPPQIARSVPKRQAEFFFGRLAARAALQDHGLHVAELPIGDAREPVWPANVVGSISHVDGLAGAVVGAQNRHVGLGLDIERVARGGAQDALRTVALTASELEHLRGLDLPLSLDERVTLAYSAKESLYKAAFGTVRRFFGFDAAVVEAIDVPQGKIVLSLTSPLHPSFPRGRRCVLAFGRLDAETFVTAFEAAEPERHRGHELGEGDVQSP